MEDPTEDRVPDTVPWHAQRVRGVGNVGNSVAISEVGDIAVCAGIIVVDASGAIARISYSPQGRVEVWIGVDRG